MEKRNIYRLLLIAVLLISAVISCPAGVSAQEADGGDTYRLFREYRKRFDGIETQGDIPAGGFRIIGEQVFPVTIENYGEVFFIPALDNSYNRLAIFLAREDGSIVYKTDELETNNRMRGELKQPNVGIAAVSFQELNGDGLTDIVLITSCMNESGAYADKSYKVGDVLFQNDQGFYRDWRLSDKINRFGMNKGIKAITSFVRDGYTTEFLYTATTLDDLLKNGFEIIEEQCYWRTFEKMGRLRAAPGTYSMADFSVFMIYLINEQGYIVWSFQPMGDYDNLYALKGINCRDIDGDGLKDIVVLARYSFADEDGGLAVESDFAIYYQRTGGFYADVDFKKQYRCDENDTMEGLVEKARAYWGWKSEL